MGKSQGVKKVEEITVLSSPGAKSMPVEVEGRRSRFTCYKFDGVAELSSQKDIDAPRPRGPQMGKSQFGGSGRAKFTSMDEHLNEPRAPPAPQPREPEEESKAGGKAKFTAMDEHLKELAGQPVLAAPQPREPESQFGGSGKAKFTSMDEHLKELSSQKDIPSLQTRGLEESKSLDAESRSVKFTTMDAHKELSMGDGKNWRLLKSNRQQPSHTTEGEWLGGLEKQKQCDEPIKLAQQCYHWKDPDHRREEPNCPKWHPDEACKLYPNCPKSAERCLDGHPFCSRKFYCRCSVMSRSKQHNHYEMPDNIRRIFMVNDQQMGGGRHFRSQQPPANARPSPSMKTAVPAHQGASPAKTKEVERQEQGGGNGKDSGDKA